MAQTKVYIDPKKAKKNGEVSIYILVHIDYKSIKFNTGVSCQVNEFDPKSCRIAGSSRKVKDDNLIIDACLARLNEIFVRYRLQNIELTADLLKNEWKNPTRRIDFHSFLDEAIEEHKADVAKNTYKSHKSFSLKLKLFKPTLSFSEINPDLLERYSRWLRSKEGGSLHVNSVHSQMRRFRAFLNIAIKKGVITENPFSKIKLKKKKTDRIYLTTEELNTLWQLYNKHELSDTLQSVLRHFLFMCFTGVRISDLKSLTINNIVNKMLVFTVQKTINFKDNIVKVPLTSQAIQLLVDENSQVNTLFDCISDQKMNEYIKKICKLDSVKIYKEVSNHTGRHTFATIFLKQTKDLAVLQKLLGHSDIKETMIYVHVDDQMIKDDMKLFQKNLFKPTYNLQQKDPDKMPESS